MSFYVDNTRMIGLKKGDRVLLYDLKGRQELNGTYGEVLSYNAEKERYAVKLEEASEKILLKLANLTLIPPPDALAELDYDILLEGEDFALLKTTLLTASSRSGATTMATQLRGAKPHGRTPLEGIVSLIDDSDMHGKALIQQACDALAKVCTVGQKAKDEVRKAQAAAALVKTMRGRHSKTSPADAKTEAEAAAKNMGRDAWADEDFPRVVDVTDGAAAPSAGEAAVDDEDADEEAAMQAALRKKTKLKDEVAHAMGRVGPSDPLLVMRAACHALCNLANGDQECKTAVMKSDGAAAFAEAMKLAPDDAMLVKTAVGGLANLAGGDTACLKAAIKANGVPLISKAVTRFVHHHPPLIGDACLALANFASRPGDGPRSVCDDGGLEALAKAVDAHAEHEIRVREWSAGCLANIASTGEGYLDDLIEANSHRTAVKVLGWCGNETEHDVRAAKLAIGVWAHLGRMEAGSDPESLGLAACKQAGFVEATVKYMMKVKPTGRGPLTPMGNEAIELVREACRAFASLAFGGDDEGPALLRDAGAKRALTEAIEGHPRDQSVQEMARALISQIDAPDNMRPYDRRGEGYGQLR